MICNFIVEECLKMLDSIWAFSKGKDKRFPKVIVAATTFAVSLGYRSVHVIAISDVVISKLLFMFL